jgi:hypothetical protein
MNRGAGRKLCQELEITSSAKFQKKHREKEEEYPQYLNAVIDSCFTLNPCDYHSQADHLHDQHLVAERRL